jgi:hypothetical protein
MSAAAVRCQWGEPDKINFYGLGDEQWVYNDEADSNRTVDYIYLKDGKVSNLQHMEN